MEGTNLKALFSSPFVSHMRWSKSARVWRAFSASSEFARSHSVTFLRPVTSKRSAATKSSVTCPETSRNVHSHYI